ncbi:leucine-rich repeat domain-containing protein [Candidatus Woesearchaeota archaeon]|nr:leucine-rich repeat domain-containing protein [Candidatus Woesearchaeota archaeon]
MFNGNCCYKIRKYLGIYLIEKLATQVNNNKFTFLPKEIGNLSSLQSLYLTNNQLTSLPKEFGNLSSLRNLNLMFNKFCSFPQEITPLLERTGGLVPPLSLLIGGNPFNT